MTLNELPDVAPAAGEVETAELVVHDDVLVKLFALGPGGAFDPHVHNARGVEHGARNESDERALLTASLCPLP